MKHLKYFKRRLKSDLKGLIGFFNPLIHFTGVFKSIKILFLMAFFPHIIMIWYSIQLYRYLFVYVFLFLDIIFYDILPSKWWLKRLYRYFYNVCYYILYHPIFRIFPKCYWWVRHKLSFIFWLENVLALLLVFVDILVYFLYKLHYFLVWLENIDEAYRNVRFYWDMRRDLIWGVKYTRRLKRQKKEEIKRIKKEERDLVRDEWIAWYKSLRLQLIMKMIDLLIFSYDKIWLVLKWYYFYDIYLRIVYKKRSWSFYSPIKNYFSNNFSLYYWKSYEIFQRLGFRYSGWLTYYRFKSFTMRLHIGYLTLCEIFRLSNIFGWCWRIYFFIYISPEIQKIATFVAGAILVYYAYIYLYL